MSVIRCCEDGVPVELDLSRCAKDSSIKQLLQGRAKAAHEANRLIVLL